MGPVNRGCNVSNIGDCKRMPVPASDAQRAPSDPARRTGACGVAKSWDMHERWSPKKCRSCCKKKSKLLLKMGFWLYVGDPDPKVELRLFAETGLQLGNRVVGGGRAGREAAGHPAVDARWLIGCVVLGVRQVKTGKRCAYQACTLHTDLNTANAVRQCPFFFFFS